MKNKFLFAFISINILFGCTTGVSLIENDFSPMLHDGNSKVWMIKELISNGNDFAKKDDIRDLLIFYENGNCILQSTHDLSTQTGQRANYRANFSQKTLTIFFKKETWEFLVEIKSEDEIILKPLPGSKTNFSLTVIPLPELIK